MWSTFTKPHFNQCYEYEIEVILFIPFDNPSFPTPGSIPSPNPSGDNHNNFKIKLGFPK